MASPGHEKRLLGVPAALARTSEFNAVRVCLIVISQALTIGIGAAAVLYEWWLVLPFFLVVIGIVANGKLLGRNIQAQVSAQGQICVNPVLVVLPTALASSSVNQGVGAGAAAVAAFGAIWLRTRNPNLQLTWFCAILPLLAVVIVMRPNHPSTVYTLVFVVIGLLATVLAIQNSNTKLDAIVSLYGGIGLFLVASLLLWLAGFVGTTDRTAGLENSITGGQRVIFPLSASLGATPGTAAVYLAAAVPVLVIVRRYRMLHILTAICATAIIILSDSRVSLLTAIALTIFVLLAPRLFRAAAPWVACFVLVLPFIYQKIQTAVAALSTEVPWLIRPDEQAGTLARRDFIWAQSLEFYATRIDWFHQMFGFGSSGHVKSGASAYYSNHFAGLNSDSSLLTPHNSMLQILFDGGWLVSCIFAVVIFCLAWKLSHQESPFSLITLCLVVALTIVGVTEVALSPTHAQGQPCWWLLAALTIVVFSRERAVCQKSEPAGDRILDAAETRSEVVEMRTAR